MNSDINMWMRQGMALYMEPSMEGVTWIGLGKAWKPGVWMCQKFVFLQLALKYPKDSWTGKELDLTALRKKISS